MNHPPFGRRERYGELLRHIGRILIADKIRRFFARPSDSSCPVNITYLLLLLTKNGTFSARHILDVELIYDRLILQTVKVGING